MLQKPKGGGRVRGGGKAGENAEANRHARGVLAVEDLDLSPYLRPGEYEAMLADTSGILDIVERHVDAKWPRGHSQGGGHSSHGRARGDV